MIFICCDKTRIHYIHIIFLFMILAYVCTYTWKFTQRAYFRRKEKARLFYATSRIFAFSLQWKLILSSFLTIRRFPRVRIIYAVIYICSYKRNESSFTFSMAHSYQCSFQTRGLIINDRRLTCTTQSALNQLFASNSTQTHTHTHAHTHARTHAHTHTHARIYTHIHACIYINYDVIDCRTIK